MYFYLEKFVESVVTIMHKGARYDSNRNYRRLPNFFQIHKLAPNNFKRND